MSTVEIECPSGMRFVARKWRVQELVELGEAADANDPDGGLSRILSSTWVDVIDPGPYAFLKPGSRPDWTRMLAGDAVVAVVRARQASLGDEYEFNFQCEQCGRKQPTMLHVSLADLTVQALPEPSKELFRIGQPLEAALPDGSKVRFALGTLGAHGRLLRVKKEWQKQLQRANDRRAQKALRPAAWDMLVRQVLFVEALGERSKDAMQLLEWAQGVPLDEFFLLRDQFEAADCGIDTRIEATCQHLNCGWEQEGLELPLRGAFFAPKSRARKDRSETEESEIAPTG